MTKRRLVGVLFFTGALLAAGAAPSGAAPAGSSASAVLRGPNHGPCYGGSATDAFGTATLQGAKAKGAEQVKLHVDVAADNVGARTTFEVLLWATVTEPIPGGWSVGCRLFPAGTVTSSPGGVVRFSGVVLVPSNIGGFNVHLGSSSAGYSTMSISIAGP